MHRTGVAVIARTLGALNKTPYAGDETMKNSGKAPTMIIWVICLVLYLVALAAHFGLAKIGAPVATWSWIIGFGLLILACRVRGL